MWRFTTLIQCESPTMLLRSLDKIPFMLRVSSSHCDYQNALSKRSSWSFSPNIIIVYSAFQLCDSEFYWQLKQGLNTCKGARTTASLLFRLEQQLKLLKAYQAPKYFTPAATILSIYSYKTIHRCFGILLALLDDVMSYCNIKWAWLSILLMVDPPLTVPLHHLTPFEWMWGMRFIVQGLNWYKPAGRILSASNT